MKLNALKTTPRGSSVRKRQNTPLDSVKASSRTSTSCSTSTCMEFSQSLPPQFYSETATISCSSLYLRESSWLLAVPSMFQSRLSHRGTRRLGDRRRQQLAVAACGVGDQHEQLPAPLLHLLYLPRVHARPQRIPDACRPMKYAWIREGLVSGMTACGHRTNGLEDFNVAAPAPAA